MKLGTYNLFLVNCPKQLIEANVNKFFEKLILYVFLPPANEVWGKIIFSEACVKNFVHGGEYLGMYSPHTRYTPPVPGTSLGPGTPPVPGTPPGPGTPPRNRYTPRTRYTPRARYTPSGQVPHRTRYTPQEQV